MARDASLELALLLDDIAAVRPRARVLAGLGREVLAVARQGRSPALLLQGVERQAAMLRRGLAISMPEFHRVRAAIAACARAA